MSEIGVVIRTHNEAALLPRMLDALMGQTEQSFEIVLVDSGSTDATVEIARRYDRVRIIEIPKKDFTYGRALNIGIAAVAERVKYVAMLSAHAIPCDENWLSGLVTPMRLDPKVAGVYGKQVPLPEHMSNPVVRAQAIETYPKCYGEKPTTTNRSYFFSNVNAAIASSSWQENGFDEFLPFCEDWHWAIAMIQSGGWIAYHPTAVVYHSHADTFRNYFIRTYKQAMAERIIDPSSFPLLGKRESLRRVKNLFVAYAKSSVRLRALVGPHWDLCRVRVVRTLSAYKGRKDARVEQ